MSERLGFEADQAMLEAAHSAVESTEAAPVCFGRMHVLPVVLSLFETHPGLSVRLQLLDRVASLPADGTDIAVRVGALADSGLHVRFLASTRPVLTASLDDLSHAGHPPMLGISPHTR